MSAGSKVVGIAYLSHETKTFRDTSVPMVKRVLNPSSIQRLQNQPIFHPEYLRLAAFYPKKTTLT